MISVEMGKDQFRRSRTRVLLGVLGVACCVVAVSAASASAFDPAAGWSIQSVAQPAFLSSNDNARCETGGPANWVCDSYTVTITNVGSRATDGTPVVIKDFLPAGVSAVAIVTPQPNGTFEEAGVEWDGNEEIACKHTTAVVECAYPSEVPAGDVLQVRIMVKVDEAATGPVANRAIVEGGGAPAVSTNEVSSVNSSASPPAGVQQFSMGVYGVDGLPDVQAGDHPYRVMTDVMLNSVMAGSGQLEAGKEPAKGAIYRNVREPRDISVYLPFGFVGNPMSVPRCRQSELVSREVGMSRCPSGSRIGSVTIDDSGQFASSNTEQRRQQSNITPLYNMVSEKGYPAEFGFAYDDQPVMMYASVVPVSAPGGHGYALRVASPGIPRLSVAIGAELNGISLTFFGNPAMEDGGATASQAFFTNPSSCSAEPLNTKIEVTSWLDTGETTSREATVYDASPAGSLAGCNMLSFDPTFELKPETTQTDTPSSDEINVKIPQAADMWPDLASPDLKNATVVLPAGVGLSPPTAEGLAGCDAEGPDGINIGSSDIGPGGQDLGDPQATELGDGHAGPGGNGSPYDDGLWHIAPGHCPANSQIGEVEIDTPLLPKPLKGHVYVAQPQCGGEGQRECTQESATNGELYGVYVEVSGSGVIVKLKGRVAADPKTGQLTATFTENPQLPFEDLRLRLDGGQRAPLANPQSCAGLPLDEKGLPVARTTSLLEPWGGPSATPSSEFELTGCANPMPFAPSFGAGAVQTLAGGFTPFTMTLSRKDGEQDFERTSVTLPPGAAGMLSKVPLCADPQAQLGTCSELSRIGTAHVAAGAGSEPLWLEGPVYLTGPYGGAPFGLSIVILAKAGPFNLGEEVVRAAIGIDPHTAQVTVTSEPLRLIRDGIPFRLKEFNVTIDRPQFMFNPTNCEQLRLIGTVSGQLPDGSPGAGVAVSTPFAVAGCRNLPFKPSFAALTRARHTRRDGASLHVVVKSSAGQANIAKVRVTLPRQLPSRLSTLKQACPRATFDANPAACPRGSFVGGATAYTPVLPVPMTGPAIFVSHGGAAFPDLDVVLQGDGVTIVLTGGTFIGKAGITTSTFATVPDVPVTRFDLVLPTGAHSALAANGNLCKAGLFMPTTIVGQNGAVVKRSTRIAVSGCGRHRPRRRARHAGKRGR